MSESFADGSSIVLPSKKVLELCKASLEAIQEWRQEKVDEAILAYAKHIGRARWWKKSVEVTYKQAQEKLSNIGPEDWRVDYNAISNYAYAKEFGSKAEERILHIQQAAEAAAVVRLSITDFKKINL
jgi:hypothetical protein